MDPALRAPRPGDLGFLEGPRGPWVQWPWPWGPQVLGRAGDSHRVRVVCSRLRRCQADLGGVFPWRAAVGAMGMEARFKGKAPCHRCLLEDRVFAQGFHCGIRTGACTLGF